MSPGSRCALALLLAHLSLASSPCRAVTPAAPAPALVRTADGAVRGALVANGTVRAFRGLPFAAPPVGVLRWRAPQPPEPWAGIRDATRFGAPCPQRARFDTLPPPDEDCLTLNLWTPDRVPAPLPVMVFVHGGGFVFGAGSQPVYDGTALAAHGVVLVTLNYRLGVLGFLAHPARAREGGASGDAGLLDQIAALRWVRGNAAAFGGDPSRVTLFGESAGGSSVDALLASPAARGLFSRAILQSPAIGWRLRERAEAERTGLVLGPDLAALRALPASTLLPFATRIQALAPLMAPVPLPFPVAGTPELPVQPQTAPIPPMPLLIGDNQAEGVDFARPWALLDRQGFAARLRAVFGPLAAQAAALYPAASDAAVPDAAARLVGDGMFYAGARTLARRAAATGAPVFAYAFDQPVAGRPPHHAEELRDVFGTLPPGATAQDRRLSERIMTAWTRFAASGDPNGPGVPPWPRFREPDEQVLHLGPVSGAAPVDVDRRRRLDFMQRALDAGP